MSLNISIEALEADVKVVFGAGADVNVSASNPAPQPAEVGAMEVARG
ncbi:MAG: hypothetical protein QW282_06285 [Nitrososphaerales archaeon]